MRRRNSTGKGLPATKIGARSWSGRSCSPSRRDVAGAFDGRATLHSSELNAVIAEALPGQISTAEVLGCRDRLAMVGYVWKPPDAEAVWQPGIPSLMTYVAGHER